MDLETRIWTIAYCSGCYWQWHLWYLFLSIMLVLGDDALYEASKNFIRAYGLGTSFLFLL